MFQNVLMVATIAAVVIAFFGGSFIGVFAAKHKINVTGAVTEVATALPVFEKVEAVAAEFLPEPYKSMANFLTNKAKNCVEVAQELCNAGNLTEDLRKAKAMDLILSVLEAEKIPVDDKIKKAVDLTIDLAATLFVPHKTVVVATTDATATTVAATTAA